ncbi:hypothetical protein C6H68_13435 [Photorhabdus luminescens]|nr:hypothetical protein C6H68_13435 [Photorhabdus luminescens]
MCVPHSQLDIPVIFQVASLLAALTHPGHAPGDTLCSLGQNCRFQPEGDRCCSILPFVDSIISIDRKLITFDSGFIR